MSSLIDKKFKESEEAFARMNEHTKQHEEFMDSADLLSMTPVEIEKYFEKIKLFTQEAERLSDETIRISKELTALVSKE